MFSTQTQYRIRGFGRILESSLILVVALAPAGARAQGVPTPPTVSISGTAPRTLALDEAIRVAESHSEAIRIARAGIERAHGRQYQARSQYMPQINAGLVYTRTLASQFESLASSAPVDTTKPPAPPGPCDQYLLDATATTDERLAGLEDANRCALGGNPFSSFGSLGFGAKNQYNLGLTFSQNLFAGGRIVAQNRAANAVRRFADIELAAQRAQLQLDVTEAYFDAALGDRLVALAESSAVQTESVLRQTQLARSVGNVSEFEMLRAQVTNANQRPIVIARQAQREVAYLRLKQLLNYPLEAPLQLTTVVDDTVATRAALAAAGFPDTLAGDRSTVRQAAEDIAAQRAALTVAKGQRWPTLALTSSYGKVAFPLTGLPQGGDFRTNWTVSLSTQFPIFTGGRIKGDQMVAEANLREAQARYDQLHELAALDTRVAINNLIQARAAFDASRGTAQQAARAYSIADVRYREGISTFVELSDSRILLEQAVAQRAIAARALQVARVRLALLPDLPLTQTGANTSVQLDQTTTEQQTQTIPQQTQPGATGSPVQSASQQTGVPQ